MTTTPEDAADRLRAHFAGVTAHEFDERLDQYCSDLALAVANPDEGTQMSQLVLFRPQPSPLRLQAYLASALTGLNHEQRQLVFQLSDVISTICNDLDIELYEPRKKTDPVHHAAISSAEVFRLDRERVLESDLVIHLCHYASTGSGEELDFATNALVPVVLVSHSENRVSRMVTGIPGLKVEVQYTEPEELRVELRDRLLELRPILEERKLAFSNLHVNIVGNRIRSLREELRLTRADVAARIPVLTVDTLTQIEESVDSTSNPSLVQLRQIATVLSTTVADLVEPSLDDRLITLLQDWVENRQEARFSGISKKDRNRIVRRLLLRVIDSLEED
jgi:transcriptional regulator with XRE-family HTH domain